MKIKIDTSEGWPIHPTECAKCKKKKPLFRHHMGNDKQLSAHNRIIYKNYWKFLDCVSLCNRCHMIIHYIYEPHVQKWHTWTPRGVMELRKNLIAICQLWLDGKIDNPAVPEAYKTRWQTSFKEWRRQHQRRSRRVAND